MKALIEKIDKLIQQGDSFTWENSSERKSHGVYGKKPSGAWNSWVSRIEHILKELVRQESEPFIYFKTGKAARIEGNYRDQFDTAKESYIGGLNALKSLLEDGDTFDELLINTKPVEKIEIVQETKNKVSNLNEKKVFIVHGHDHNLKIELEVFLSHIGLKPIVLHREADEGKTIIEKFETNSDVAYVFILLTPDEIAYTIDQEMISELERKKEYRARPNVIFEFGYFIAKLLRSRVCALHKGNVAIPSDLSGFIYKQVDTNVEEIGFALIKELKAAGLKLEI
ncbi:MAG: nucleotide-binding protein [Bacteroidota bacterium]